MLFRQKKSHNFTVYANADSKSATLTQIFKALGILHPSMLTKPRSIRLFTISRKVGKKNVLYNQTNR